jgi:hypothetical protein
MMLNQKILQSNSYKSFQKPENISDALSYIWNEKHKWQVISSKIANINDENIVKTQLKNIVIRRDQIAHEGDCPSDTIPLVRQDIDISDVEETLVFIKKVAQAIFDCLCPNMR